MKTVVCREDIKAELDMLSDMQQRIQMLETLVSGLHDRVNFLEQKNSAIPSVNIREEWVRTWDEPHNYWWEAISNTSARLQDAAERIRQDWHWDINDGWTLTFVRN